MFSSSIPPKPNSPCIALPQQNISFFVADKGGFNVKIGSQAKRRFLVQFAYTEEITENQMQLVLFFLSLFYM